MSKKRVNPDKPVTVPMTEEEMAVKHNHTEVINQLNAHFNGNEVEKKNALKNLDKAFDNLVVANKKVQK